MNDIRENFLHVIFQIILYKYGAKFQVPKQHISCVNILMSIKLTLGHDFRNSVKIQNGLYRKHKNSFKFRHYMSHGLLLHFQCSCNNVHFILLQIIVLVSDLWRKV